MFHIYKMRDDHVLGFAAEELKKYLWMMMPECGNTPISVNWASTASTTISTQRLW